MDPPGVTLHYTQKTFRTVEKAIDFCAMTLLERQAGDVTLLDLKGRLVFDDGDTVLRERVNDLVARGRVKIIVNLRDVTYIDSCGLGVLIAKYVSARQNGGNMKLLNLSARSHRVIEISGLEQIFEAFDSEDDAVASFAAGRGA